MYHHKNRDLELWLGLWLFVIGVVFLLIRFDVIPAVTWAFLWPSILIVTGLKLMVAAESCENCPSDSKPMSATPAMAKKPSAPAVKASPKKKPAKKGKK